MQGIEEVQYLESLNSPVIKLGLSEIKELLNRLGNPENKLTIIHVAGTNGKGSVCQFIRSILQEKGKTVGVFSSPHLLKVNESIRIDNRDITDKDLSYYICRVKEVIDVLHKEEVYPTYFEVLTALAFLYFYDRQVDFVILEVGLGGALDATNVIEKSLVSVITKISMDHVDFLGDTLEKIAEQKAGIIKDGGMVITPIQDDAVMKVIKERCAKQHAELLCMDSKQMTQLKTSEEGTHFLFEGVDYALQMIGAHQAYNCSIAIKVTKWLCKKGLLELTQEDIKRGVFKATWQGRFEKVNDKPKIFVDGAHNLDGIKALASTMDCLKTSYRIGIIGILRDKEIDEMLKVIHPKFDVLIVAKPNNPRAMEVDVLAKKIRSYHHHAIEAKSISQAVKEALELSKINADACIIAFGSLYMIGEVRSLFCKKKHINI